MYFTGLAMNRRSFGHLLFGVPALIPTSVSEPKPKLEKPDLSEEIEAEQAHLRSLRDWLSSSESNPYSAPYVPGIQTLVMQSEKRIQWLRTR